MFAIYKCIVIRNFESKHDNFSSLQNMIYQELKHQIHIDVKAKYIQKSFSRGKIDVLNAILLRYLVYAVGETGGNCNSF